jgi:hypothetical protein
MRRGEERADLSEAVLKLLARSVVLGILVVHQQQIPVCVCRV